MKRYCLSCGAPTEYSLKKPTFCSSCGKSFEGSSPMVVQKSLIPKKTIARNINEENLEIEDDFDDIDGEDITSVPNINKLDVEIEQERSSRGIKIGEIIGTDKRQDKKNRIKPKVKKISKKETLENFQKEAGALRPSRRK